MANIRRSNFLYTAVGNLQFQNDRTMM